MRKHNKRTLFVRLGYCYLTEKKECLVIVLTRQKHFSYRLVDGENMKCPHCDNDFLLTWNRYIKAPIGRMSCPSCHAKLVVTHRWFYWPLVILGCCILGIPLAILGANYGLAGALTGWFVGAFGFGIPFDRFLEIRFSVLRMRQDETSNRPTGSEVQ